MTSRDAAPHIASPGAGEAPNGGRRQGRFIAQRSEAERFWALVDRHELAGCWLWQGHTNRDGYGQFKVTIAPGRYRTVRAHRWAWEHAHGPVPEGLTLDHLCGHPRCVRPGHLEPVTAAENLRRRHARRHATGPAPGQDNAAVVPVPDRTGDSVPLSPGQDQAAQTGTDHVPPGRGATHSGTPPPTEPTAARAGTASAGDELRPRCANTEAPTTSENPTAMKGTRVDDDHAT